MKQKQKNKVWLVGGGTAGHILPLLPMAEQFKKNNFEVTFILADASLDRVIAEKNLQDYDVKFLKTGKIRSYVSLKNISDLFRVMGARFTAKKWIKNEKPDIIFCKGGFVCYPIVAAASHHKNTKIYLHESDLTTGRLTKFIAKRAKKVFRAFDEECPMPLFYNNEKKGMIERLLGAIPHQKQLLVFGGAQGAQFLNELVEKSLEELTKTFAITLITGPGKAIKAENPNLQQYEVLDSDTFATHLRASDVILSRGGSGALFEIIKNKKPSLIVPLPWAARDHQSKNAVFFAEKSLIHLAKQRQVNEKNLLEKLQDAMNDESMKKALDGADYKSKHKEMYEEIAVDFI